MYVPWFLLARAESIRERNFSHSLTRVNDSNINSIYNRVREVMHRRPFYTKSRSFQRANALQPRREVSLQNRLTKHQAVRITHKLHIYSPNSVKTSVDEALTSRLKNT